jgi:uncharacterized protein YlzI (FlbEa/FlbD family)
MIVLHNLRGEPIAINGGLIERVEGETETHVTLTSGTSYIVRESLEEVVACQREDRAEVQAAAIRRLTSEEPTDRRLRGELGSLRLVHPVERDEQGEGS